jgi:hypothetical protein
MAKQKVYSVTMEVKVVIRATSKGDAILQALETNRINERLQSAKVTDVVCPADGE